MGVQNLKRGEFRRFCERQIDSLSCCALPPDTNRPHAWIYQFTDLFGSKPTKYRFEFHIKTRFLTCHFKSKWFDVELLRDFNVFFDFIETTMRLPLYIVAEKPLFKELCFGVYHRFYYWRRPDKNIILKELSKYV